MAYVPRDDDEYRQKDEVPSRGRRLLHKLRYKLKLSYNSLIYSTITLNCFQLISVVLFTAVLFLITGYLLASQYYEYLLTQDAILR